MGRRIRWLGVIMVACLGLVIAQLVNIQLVKAKAAADLALQPRISVAAVHQPPRERSPPPTAPCWPSPSRRRPGPTGRTIPTTTSASTRRARSTRVSPATTRPLLRHGADIEKEYDSYLGPHQQPPQTLSQLLFREQLPTTTDDVTLTVEPSLQNAASQALTTLPPGDNKDGAVVVLQP